MSIPGEYSVDEVLVSFHVVENLSLTFGMYGFVYMQYHISHLSRSIDYLRKLRGIESHGNKQLGRCLISDMMSYYSTIK